MIQVPAEGWIRVWTTGEENEFVHPFQPAQVTAPLTTSEGFQEHTPVSGPRPEGLFPTVPVEVSSRLRCRGTAMVRLSAYPFRWDESRRELRVTRRMTIHVAFERPLTADDSLAEGNRPRAELSAGDREFEGIKRGLLLNRAPDEATAGPAALARTASVPTGPATDALKMTFRQEGPARITYEALVAAGVPADVDPASLRLVCQGRDAALRLASSDAVFGPGDAVEFFAATWRNSYTDANVYWLMWGGQGGPRIAGRNGAPSGGDPLAPWYERTLRFEQNLIWWSTTPGAPEADYLFWEKFISPMSRSYAIQAPNFEKGAGGAAVMRAVYVGRTTTAPHPNHHTLVSVNSTPLGDDRWDGLGEYVQFFPVPSSVLKEGENTVTIQVPGDNGGPADILYLNRFELVYPCRFRAEGDRIDFTLETSSPVRVEMSGFTSSAIRVFDVTDPDLPVEIDGVQVSSAGGAHTAAFGITDNGPHRFFAVGEPAWLTPQSALLRHPLHLSDPANGADLLIVTAEDFVPAVRPLAELRARQGLRVAVVGVEALYDEFNWGIFHPRAVKDFIAAAYWTWVWPRPAYALFVGDANLDYHDDIGTGRRNRVPAYLKSTGDIGLTPVDNWYVCVDGDDEVPEMFQGRMPAADAASAAAVVQKVMQYEAERQLSPLRVNLTADNIDPSFEAVSEQVSALIPTAYLRDKVYLSQYTNFAKAKTDLFASFNSGLTLSNFVGHGSVTNWAGEMICTIADMGLLESGKPLMFIVSTTCLNAYFAQPTSYSLGEAFMAVPGKGAAACFMSSGLTYDWENQEVDRRLMNLIFSAGNTILGPLTLRARMEAYQNGATGLALDTYQLLGDPLMRLRTTLLGDVNGDGDFDASDLSAMAAAMVGDVGEGQAPCRIPAAGDFNRNLRMDAQDLSTAMALLVGIMPWPIPPA